MVVTKRLIAGGGLCLAILAPLPAASETIVLEQQHGIFMVPVRINDVVTIPFVLDSGASTVVITADVFSVLQRTGTISKADFKGTGTSVLADGSKISSDLYVLHKMAVGGHVIIDVIATVTPAQGAPLLGQSFLSKLPTWSIDNQRHALVFNDGAQPPQAAVSVPISPALPTSTVPGPAIAGHHGAIAFDETAAKYGFAVSLDTQQRAFEMALRTCNSERCKVVMPVGPQKCAAFATAEKGTAWGGNIDVSLNNAKLRALQNCQKNTTLPCVLRVSFCNQ